MRHSLLRIWLGTLAISLLLLPAMGSGDTMGRFDRVGHQMMCICGCGQILLECNHVGCPSSAGMRTELETAVSSGLTDKQVYDQFIQKYGPTVMAAPVFHGFNILAWIMPGVVLLLGTFGIALLLYSWRKRQGLTPAAATSAKLPVNDAMRDRIRRETEL
jgi:cytochrome c-type biogenesis protein CcmH